MQGGGSYWDMIAIAGAPCQRRQRLQAPALQRVLLKHFSVFSSSSHVVAYQHVRVATVWACAAISARKV